MNREPARSNLSPTVRAEQGASREGLLDVLPPGLCRDVEIPVTTIREVEVEGSRAAVIPAFDAMAAFEGHRPLLESQVSPRGFETSQPPLVMLAHT